MPINNPGGGAGRGSWAFVATQTLLAGADGIEFTGLDLNGDTDGQYKMLLTGVTSGNTDIDAFVNGLTTRTDYASSTQVGAGFNTNNTAYQADGNTDGFAWEIIWMRGSSGFPRSALYGMGSRLTPLLFHGSVVKDATVLNITEVRVECTTGVVGFGIGTTATLYKLSM